MYFFTANEHQNIYQTFRLYARAYTKFRSFYWKHLWKFDSSVYKKQYKSLAYFPGYGDLNYHSRKTKLPGVFIQF